MGRPVDLYDVRRVDAALGATLEKLAAAAAAGGANGRAGGAPMLVDGVSVEDLCLSFVLPGPAHAVSESAESRSFRIFHLMQSVFALRLDSCGQAGHEDAMGVVAHLLELKAAKTSTLLERPRTLMNQQ